MKNLIKIEEVLAAIPATPTEYGLELISEKIALLNLGDMLDIPEIGVIGVWLNKGTGMLHYSVPSESLSCKQELQAFLRNRIVPNLSKFN